MAGGSAPSARIQGSADRHIRPVATHTRTPFAWAAATARRTPGVMPSFRERTVPSRSPTTRRYLMRSARFPTSWHGAAWHMGEGNAGRGHPGNLHGLRPFTAEAGPALVHGIAHAPRVVFGEGPHAAARPVDEAA